MQHPFGAITRNFRLIRVRKFRGQQPADPAGYGETRVVSVKCLMSLNDHLFSPGGTSPPCFSFTRFIVEQCLLKRTSVWPLQRRRSACLCSLSTIPSFASLIAGYLPMLREPNHAKTRMSMVQLVSVAEEADLNFTWSVLKS